MENYTFNQAMFGLMLLGARADGHLQDNEKDLLVELTSEDHHLPAEECKFVITELNQKTHEDFRALVYQSLNAHPPEERVKAAYWLLQVIKADNSSDDSDENGHNQKEMEIYRHALAGLGLQASDVDQYDQTREE